MRNQYGPILIFIFSFMLLLLQLLVALNFGVVSTSTSSTSESLFNYMLLFQSAVYHILNVLKIDYRLNSNQ